MKKSWAGTALCAFLLASPAIAENTKLSSSTTIEQEVKTIANTCVPSNFYQMSDRDKRIALSLWQRERYLKTQKVKCRFRKKDNFEVVASNETGTMLQMSFIRSTLDVKANGIETAERSDESINLVWAYRP